MASSSDPAAAPGLVVALTGGVASGKSAVASRFAALGAQVFDADAAARAAVAIGTPGLAEVVAAFGTEFVGSDGALNRPKLRELVFADSEARKRLEAIVHPRVHAILVQQLESARGTYAMLAIPLLVETWQQYRWVDRVLVVDVEPEIQIARLLLRDGIDRKLAQEMLASQASRGERLALADDVIDNNGPIDALDAQVAELHRRYLESAGV